MNTLSELQHEAHPGQAGQRGAQRCARREAGQESSHLDGKTSVIAYLSTSLTAVAAAITVLTLAGCAAMGDADRPLAKMNDAGNYAAQKSLPAQGGQWPAANWTESLADPQLKALIDEALAGNPSLQAAQVRIAAARAAVSAADSATKPSYAVNAESTYQRISENFIYPSTLAGNWFTLNDATVSAKYDLDLWGRHSTALKSAVAQDMAAQAEAQAVKLTLTAAVARAYNQLGLQIAQRDLVKRNLDLCDQFSALTQQRLKAGLDTRIEDSTSRGNRASAALEVQKLDEQIDLTRHQLAALLGKGQDRGLKIAAPRLQALPAPRLPDNAQIDLLSRRPDLMAARWRVEAAGKDVQTVKSEFMPNISLSGKNAAHDNAVASYNQTLTEALRELADQVAGIENTEKQIEQQNVVLQAARHGWELSQTRYKVGLGSQLQVLGAESA
ncbi:MAG: efflux transporter outer membrane subunit [Candidatus Protistobacter heckmanni]|nr:efflux transporter outer membrane subunit [Candidatus Protistobacter heckmanni]